MTIIEKLEDLVVQATKERSHYYVKSVCEEAIATIHGMEEIISGMAKIIAKEGFKNGGK